MTAQLWEKWNANEYSWFSRAKYFLQTLRIRAWTYQPAIKIYPEFVNIIITTPSFTGWEGSFIPDYDFFREMCMFLVIWLSLKCKNLRPVKKPVKANAQIFTPSALCFVPQMRESTSPGHGQISKKLFRWSLKIMWCHLQHASRDGASAAAFSSQAETARMNDNVATVGAAWLIGDGKCGPGWPHSRRCVIYPFFLLPVHFYCWRNREDVIAYQVSACIIRPRIALTINR